MRGEDEVRGRPPRKCVLCGLTFTPKNVKSRFCELCCAAMCNDVRTAMAKAKWRIDLYRYILLTTGRRVAVYDNADNRRRHSALVATHKRVWHTADECPRDCRFLGKCGGDDCCDYVLVVGHSRPKESGPIGRECKEYTPLSEEEIRKHKRGRFNHVSI